MSAQQPNDFKIYKDQVGRKGRIFVISGPSGVGKGTVISSVISRTPGLILSVSALQHANRDLVTSKASPITSLSSLSSSSV